MGIAYLFHNVYLSSQKPVQDLRKATRRGEYIHKKIAISKAEALIIWNLQNSPPKFIQADAI